MATSLGSFLGVRVLASENLSEREGTRERPVPRDARPIP